MSRIASEKKQSDLTTEIYTNKSNQESIENELASRKKKAVFLLRINILIFVVCFFVFVFVFWLIFNTKTKTQEEIVLSSPAKETQTDLLRRKIDGVYVPKDKTDPSLFAVMIDNHREARPQSALSEALLVFEAEVEGGITRFMAVFDSEQSLEEIGPIRSARPYFVDWAQELQALYVHVGGSPDALVKISRKKIKDINEFYNENYFWRSESRSRPHNVYSSSKSLNEYSLKHSYNKNNLSAWRFKDDLELDKRPATSSVEIAYLLNNYYIKWKYDRANNKYLRYVNNKPYQDKMGQFVGAKNLIIQFVKAKQIDEKLRLDMKDIGSGSALVCLDGKCTDAEWQKSSAISRSKYYNNKKELEFNAGKTWIQVLRPEIKLVY